MVDKRHESNIKKSDDKNKKPNKNNKSKKRKKKTLPRAVAAFIILLVLLIVMGSLYVFSFMSGLNTDCTVEGKAPLSEQPLNILILGMDIGDTEQVENKALRRTDTMMLLNYNPSTDAVNIVSIPRDTLIEVEDAYDAEGNYIPYWKMNAAYALGGEEEVVSQVQNLLGVTVNYLVEIDYEAFRNIIDAIGGVEMYIESNMYYDDNSQDLHIHFNEGDTVLLDGQKAEEFIRWRKNSDGTGLANGDLGRIANQQKFLKKVIDKVTSPSIIFSISDIMNAIKNNVVTNMPASKMFSYGFKILKNAGISMTTLQGEEQIIYDQSFLVVNREDNLDILNALKSGSVADISRSRYKLLVLNGTEVTGLAASYRDDLKNLGYENIEIDNTSSTSKSQILCNDSELLEVLKSDAGINNSNEKTNEEYSDYDAVIIIGSDYN